jgi:molybdopterin-guanine dinucleotide biosynthesis protein A
MGRPKGELRLDGVTLAERAAKVLRPLCGNVLISLPRGSRNPAPSFAVVEDEPPAGRGPLSGIAAAFASTGRADLLVLACDYPAADADLFRVLLAEARSDAHLVVPTDATGRDHPLVALWRRSAEPFVDAALAAGSLKVQALFAELEVQRLPAAALAGWGIDVTLALANVNWPSELEGFGIERP